MYRIVTILEGEIILEITKVNITKIVKGDPKLKAYAEAYIDEGFIITGLRVVEGKNGLFVAMPSREGRRKEGDEGYTKHHDIVHPINAEVRKQFTDAIIPEYQRKLEEA